MRSVASPDPDLPSALDPPPASVLRCSPPGERVTTLRGAVIAPVSRICLSGRKIKTLLERARRRCVSERARLVCKVYRRALMDVTDVRTLHRVRVYHAVKRQRGLYMNRTVYA